MEYVVTLIVIYACLLFVLLWMKYDREWHYVIASLAALCGAIVVWRSNIQPTSLWIACLLIGIVLPFATAFLRETLDDEQTLKQAMEENGGAVSNNATDA